MRLIAAALLLAACGPTEGEVAMAELSVSMRAQSDMVRRGAALPEIFDGRCTDDCSGHRAGYLWALDRSSVREEHCAESPSASFREGCVMGVRAASFE